MRNKCCEVYMIVPFIGTIRSDPYFPKLLILLLLEHNRNEHLKHYDTVHAEFVENR